MSDTISRADAIEQIQTWAVNLINPKMLSREDAIYILESMPSAETEIIRCKDCRKNPNWEWVGCPMTGKDTRKPDDFCSYAERKSNG